MTVTSVQFEPRPSDVEHNLRRIRSFVTTAAGEGTDLIVFPEMCLVGYWHLRNVSGAGLQALAQSRRGAAVSAVRRLARETDIGIGVGFLESDEGRLFNSYAVCLPDGTVHVHRKLHAFEHPAISSGDEYTVFDSPWGVRLGVLVCWDNNLVENVRATALLGADVLIAPHQTGGTASRSPFAMQPIPTEVWENRAADPAAVRRAFQGPSGREWLMRWLPARAHDNGLFVVFSNGVGRDDDEIRTGNAMIIDCYGRIVAETDAITDAAVTAVLDLDLLPMCTGRRWIRGRRPELYDVLLSRFGDELDPRAARFSADPVAARAPAT